jgi:aminocarboxymuconate-semialdehyde decarboxylase
VKIDWHTHVYPPEEAAKPSWQGRCPMALENVLDVHRDAGVDRMVVSNPVHYIKGLPDEQAFKGIQRWDEYSAEVAQRFPDETLCFATTVPGGGDHYLKELERAVTQYRLRGVLINSSHNAHYPDEDAAQGFWELVTRLDIPVMIHAPNASFGEECMNMYRLISSIGRPADEMLSIARILVRGVFERHPDLKLVGCHLGGGICEVIGRLNYAYELGDFCFFLGSYEPLLISKAPGEYLKLMYMDSAAYHWPAVMCAINTVGIDHVVFGSDAPPLAPLLPKAVQLVEELPISVEDKEKIFYRNPARLLKLEIPQAALQVSSK